MARELLAGLLRGRAGVYNGVAERFIRTVEEECLYLHDFESLEEARHEIGAFIERYNRGWLLERHGYKTTAQVRQELTRKAARLSHPLVQETGTGSPLCLSLMRLLQTVEGA